MHVRAVNRHTAMVRFKGEKKWQAVSPDELQLAMAAMRDRSTVVFGRAVQEITVGDSHAVRVYRDEVVAKLSKNEVTAAEVRLVAPLAAQVPPPTEARPTAPVAGQIILTFLAPRDQAEAAVGDLVEQFDKLVGLYGGRVALTWYWWDVARSTARYVVRGLLSLIPFWEAIAKLISR